MSQLNAGTCPHIPAQQIQIAPLMLHCSNESLTRIYVYRIMFLERKEQSQRSFDLKL